MSDLQQPLTERSRDHDPRQERPDRDATTGQFLPGHLTNVKHGAYQSLDRPEALAAITGKRDEIIRDLGGDLAIIKSDLVTDYARTDVLIESVARNIEVGGIFTPKGSSRAAVTLLLSLMDRRQRLAQALGLERHVKPVNPLDAVRQAVIEANQK